MNPPKAGMEYSKSDTSFPKNGREPGPLVQEAIRLEDAARLKEYRELFAKEHFGPYILQHPERDWKTRYKPVSDPLLKAHLAGKYWVGVPGGWYTKFATIDFDRPTEAKIQQTIETLGLSKGQYLLFTSPSWWESKNCHLYFPVEYRGKFPTCKLSLKALSSILDPKLEIYPQAKKPFRLPLGKNQFPIGEDGFPQGWIHWHQALDELLTLEPLAIETLPFAPELPFQNKEINRGAEISLTRHNECAELWKCGLQENGSRHEALKKLAKWFYRRNIPLDRAIDELVEWQRRKSNGFSKLVAMQNWPRLRSETERVLTWYYDKMPLWPDNLHNLDAGVAVSDVIQGAQLFPGDVVNQKRWINLVSYVRPRRRNAWVYVPADVWRDGTDRRNVEAFRQTLECKGVAEVRHSYRHVEGRPDLSFSKALKLKLDRFHDVPMEDDGRNIVDYYAAVRHVCSSVNDAVSLTGVRKELFYRAQKRKMSDNSFEIK